MKIKPLENRILIQPAKEKEARKSGIIIPDGSKEKPVKGIVKVIGIDVSVLKVGDNIIHGKYSGIEIEINEEVYLLMREEDVIAIME